MAFFALALVVAGAIGWSVIEEDLGREGVRAVTENLDTSTVVAFLVVFVLLTLFFVPATPFYIAAGMFFGALWGTMWSLLAAFLSAGAAFVLARHGSTTLRGRIEAHLERLPRRLDLEDLPTVVLLRLLLPFGLVSYGLGFGRLRAGGYLTATLLGTLPWVVASVSFGALVGRLGSGIADIGAATLLVTVGALAVVLAIALQRRVRRLGAGVD
ncbi:MAG: VTT domain-containing protein [Euryarchaeota archaeon]|nr:VTT domain-containing protein [Euryarchaeota archaeon]